jgi:hypothetical protein
MNPHRGSDGVGDGPGLAEASCQDRESQGQKAERAWTKSKPFALRPTEVFLRLTAAEHFGLAVAILLNPGWDVGKGSVSPLGSGSAAFH